MSSKLIVSEYNQENYPLFSSFLKLYYKYSDIRTNAGGAIKFRSLDTDVDETLDAYLNEFYDTYGNYLPKTTAFDRRNLIKLLNAIYEAKGTENSFKLLFKLLYDETVSLSYPSENILRASDGIWYQESFITASTISGDPEFVVGNEIRIRSQNAIFVIPVRIERLNESDTRIYFVKTLNFDVSVNDTIECYSGATLVYESVIKESPVGLRIINKGLNFELGQLYVINGSSQPTIFKIKTIDTDGGILSTEIINHGYEHPTNVVTFISPYKAPPSSSNTNINVIETAPGEFTIEIGISETLFGISETITGSSTGNSVNSYFLEDYVESSYNGSTFLSQTIISGSESDDFSGSVESYGISIEDYLNSRAYVALTYAPLVSKPGAYKNNQGHISDQTTRLQDNYYYQLYSYVLQNNMNISSYRDTIMRVLHPAGLKAFFNYSLEDAIDITSTIGVDGKYTYLLDVFEEVKQTEILGKTILRSEDDDATAADAIFKSINKDQPESVTIVDSVPTKTIDKTAPETISVTEVVNKSVGRTLSELLSSLSAVNDSYASTYFASDYTIVSTAAETFNLLKV